MASTPSFGFARLVAISCAIFVAGAAHAQPSAGPAESPQSPPDAANVKPRLELHGGCQDSGPFPWGNVRALVEIRNVGEIESGASEFQLDIENDGSSRAVAYPALQPGANFVWRLTEHPDGCGDCRYSARLGPNPPQEWVCNTWNPVPGCGLLGIEPLPLVLLALRRRRARSAAEPRATGTASTAARTTRSCAPS
jgi:hypothetical protein